MRTFRRHMSGTDCRYKRRHRINARSESHQTKSAAPLELRMSGLVSEKKVGDLDNVVGRLLAVAFNAVGRDVVQERGLMATGRGGDRQKVVQGKRVENGG